MTGPTLKGKTAVLTGAARGIGKAVADALIEKGANVVIGDLLDSQGEALVASYNTDGKRAAYIHADVTKYKEIVALFQLAEKEFGGVDIAILNAGIASNSNNLFTDLNDLQDERMIDVNVTSVIKCTKVATLHLARRGGGVIVSTASVAGFHSGGISLAPYTASKHAVVGYTRAFDILPSICNVRVNAVCPYWVETDLITSLHPDDDSTTATPFEKLVINSARTKIETVVEAFMTLIEDESRIGKLILDYYEKKKREFRKVDLYFV
ncbi:uncharacterized protein BX664DRAFT_322984 [Halteromyces radiatus]|uniref:uncharacterized protein n=1 Tax=Halteromyces radiatus TaxID=101107 RepID=UPI00221F5A18|nr:uncharacterized protein BX664DRAFT_322984 [Halteromyces radiatus]KAI8100141.1 hypothetical protein BX664DRAFT_322984 [Halteromyces radiatus]